MKTYITIGIYFLFLILLSRISYADSITVKYIPEKIKEQDSINFILVTFFNESNDTLITPINIFAEGLIDKENFVFPLSGKYYPNILFFLNEKSIIPQGSGFVMIDYCSFPKLLIIPPFTDKTIKINLKEFSNIIYGNDWTLLGKFRFACKNKLDSIVRFHYKDRLDEYNNSLIISDTILNNIRLLNLNNNINGCEDSNKNINEIKKAFNIIPFIKKD